MQVQNPKLMSNRVHLLIAVIGMILVFTGLAACTAHYPINKSVTSTEAVERYSVQDETRSNRSDELLLILTFSGGGT